MTTPLGKGHVTNHVRQLREAAGLTQAELGARVGVTRQTIIAIEAEKYAQAAGALPARPRPPVPPPVGR